MSEIANNKAFCILPWTHMCVHAYGVVKPCCAFRGTLGNTKESTLQEIWNDEAYKSLRLDMLKGVKNSACQTCYIREENNGSSMRTFANSDYPSISRYTDNMNSDGSMKNLELEWLDIRLSSVCNFKCRTCEPGTSSMWADEEVQFGEKLPSYMTTSQGFHLLEINNEYPILPQIKEVLKTVKMIYFSGGEPLLHPEHYDMLEYLIESGNTNVRLKYNSNLSVLAFKGRSVVDLWKHFKTVDYYASLDSTGEREEYIRHGAKWKVQLDNLQILKEQVPHVSLTYNVVVSIFNVVTLSDFLEEMDDILPPEKYGYNSPHLERLVTPEEFSIKVLDSETKKVATDKLTKWLESHKDNKKYSLLCRSVADIIDFMKDDHTHLMPVAKKFIDKIDNRRGENFVKTFPELENFYKLCGTKIDE